MTVAALSVPLALHAPAILVGLPLWIVSYTDAPHTLVPGLLVANTVLAVLFQVRASRGAETVSGAAIVARRAGLWLATGCLAVVAASWLDAALAIVLLCVSALFLTLAELQQAASAWGLAHGLAPDTAQAEYLGAFNLYNVAQSVFGPTLLVAAVGWAGAWGWALVAGASALAGFLMPAAAAAALNRTRTCTIAAGQALNMES